MSFFRKNNSTVNDDGGSLMSDGQKTALFFVIIWIIMNIAAIIYVSVSRDIYTGEAAVTWNNARAVASGALGDGLWRRIYRSVGTADYISALPSALWVKLFGESRLVYVLSILNMYTLPSLIVTYFLAKRLGKAYKFSAAVTILIFPAAAFLTFIGYADVGGLLFGELCVYLYLTADKKRLCIRRHIAIGLLLTLMILWRKWYAFFAVSFVTAMLADCLILRKKALPPLITLFTAALVILLFFRDFFYTQIIAYYGNIYSGYRLSVVSDIKLILRYFGLLTLLGLAAGSIAAGIKKGEKRTIFLWMQLAVCFVMFIFTGAHTQQNLLLYIPSLTAMLIILMRHIHKLPLLACVCAAAVLNSVNIQLPRTQPNSIDEIKYFALIPDFSMRPLKKPYTDDILSLKKKLDSAVEAGKTAGVVSVSDTLSAEELINAEPSLGLKKQRPDYIENISDNNVSPLFDANYTVVAFADEPLGNKDAATEKAAECFYFYTGFAKAYDEIYDFETRIGDCTVKLYKRNRTVPDEDINSF